MRLLQRWRSRTLRIFPDSAYLLCSPKMTHHHTGAVALLPPGNRTARPPELPVKTNWFGKNERVTKKKKHGGGTSRSCPRANVRKSCSPFLSDLQNRFENQYRVRIEPVSGKGVGHVKVRTETPGLKVEAPAEIYVR